MSEEQEVNNGNVEKLILAEVKAKKEAKTALAKAELETANFRINEEQLKNEDLTAKLEKMNAINDTNIIKNEISAIALSNGLHPQAVDTITRDALEVFKVEDGVLKAKDGFTTKKQFVDSMKRENGYYFGIDSSNSSGNGLSHIDKLTAAAESNSFEEYKLLRDMKH